MVVQVEWNDFHEEWDIDSGPPSWIHTAESSRDKAIKTARRLKADGEDIMVKGPRMSQFKKV